MFPYLHAHHYFVDAEYTSSLMLSPTSWEFKCHDLAYYHQHLNHAFFSPAACNNPEKHLSTLPCIAWYQHSLCLPPHLDLLTVKILLLSNCFSLQLSQHGGSSIISIMQMIIESQCKAEAETQDCSSKNHRGTVRF